jgi:hypothetical protein
VLPHCATRRAREEIKGFDPFISSPEPHQLEVSMGSSELRKCKEEELRK